MKTLLIASAAVVGLIGSSASAQNAVYWPAPATGIQAKQISYLPMGTPLILTTRSQVSTKDNKAGDRIYLEVAEGISYRGQVIVPAGAVAVGEVARADRNGHFGKKGKLDIHLLYVETPSGPIRLSGQANDEGTSGTITSVATIVLVSPLGFLVHGTSAHIPYGTTVKAYLAEDMKFAVQDAAVQAVMIQPDARPLPTSFDPAVFGAKTAQR